MKKLMAIAILLLGTSSIALAQKKSKAIVPAAVKQAFETQYAGTKAKWDDENGRFEASFKKANQDMSVLYNADGSVEETELSIPVAALPANIKTYITTQKLGKVKEAAKITKANGTVEYEAEVQSGDALFDSGGNFIKIVKD